MNDTNPNYVDLVAVKNGTITYVGNSYNILKMIKKDGTTNIINLNGKTMLPGFIDSHSHLTIAAYNSFFCNL
jgi:predicted amidohydrolase YtcJ